MLRPHAGIQIDQFYPSTQWKDTNNQQIDIRKGAENNSIVILYGENGSDYLLFGLLAKVSSGTYDVYVDDIKVGNAITSNAQFDIDFSSITTSYGTTTYPESLTLHKVVVKPTTNGQTITLFKCMRNLSDSSADREKIGVMWYHFELTNNIDTNQLSGRYATNSIYPPNLFAITCKGDILHTHNTNLGNLTGGSSDYGAYGGQYVQYLPTLHLLDNNVVIGMQNGRSVNSTLKRIKLINDNQVFISTHAFRGNENIEQITFKNLYQCTGNGNCGYAFYYTNKLKVLPKTFNTNQATQLSYYLKNNFGLFPTKVDVSNLTGLKIITCTGDFINNIKINVVGLKVSSAAPFDASGTQIDVSYTNMTREALVELFNSLPTVTGTQKLACKNCLGTDDLTNEDIAIATNKGWGVTIS